MQKIGSRDQQAKAAGLIKPCKTMIFNMAKHIYPEFNLVNFEIPKGLITGLGIS
jgi:hypothetical protein